MSSSRPFASQHTSYASANNMAIPESGSLDVDWLLHSKRDHAAAASDKITQKGAPAARSSPQVKHTEPTPPQSPVDADFSSNATHSEADNGASERKALSVSNGSHVNESPVPAKYTPPQATISPSQQQKEHPVRPSITGRLHSNNENQSPSKNAVNNLKKDTGRRSSWMSSLKSTFSSNSPTTPRINSGDSQTSKTVPSPQPSPGLEFGNPFEKKMQAIEEKKEPDKKDEQQQQVPQSVVYAHKGPRRASVLTPAGKETKLEHPGFLSSALRRLSSSNAVTLGKGAGQGAVCPRKVMNVDQNRERVKIPDFDQNKLKRVAFRVDVEIAGFASQADEEPHEGIRPPLSAAAGNRQAPPTSQTGGKKESKEAKYKDKGEGAALKNPAAATVEKDDMGKTKADAIAEVDQARDELQNKGVAKEEEMSKSEPQSVPTTRKKEKKKRSEAERKERRERKRRHAEANGLIPLEITREDDSSDSSPSSTPPGATTPKRSGDQPTTDPLRIYKRCCQLRETTALNRVKEQIAKPAATLAEAPGTVAVVDLSGLQLPLQDIVTLGDWLAVVPVRKLILDDCNLGDEAIRVILSGLSSCKSAEQAKLNRKLPKRLSGKRGQEQVGVIEKLSLKNNSAITNMGWKHIALFLHMSKSLKAIDLSGIPFPKGQGDLSRSTTTSSTGTGTTTANGASTKTGGDLGALITRAIAERMGDKLEELILSRCNLSTANVSDMVDCAIKCQIKRLGLAENGIDQDGLGHVVRYIKSGTCEGLDLGGNNLHGVSHVIANAIDESNPLFAISFADCSLTPDDLTTLFVRLMRLGNLKFVDLSRNPALFSGSRNAVSIFRKLLPKFEALKRLHLSDLDMTPDQVIALAEILPDCPALCHISILENEPLIHAMNSKDGSSQEEACAFFASIMTAVRVSSTIIAIEIEVPSSDSSEVVRALASQVVAYSLRNMERSALDEYGVNPMTVPNKDAPEVLLHLVGHMDGYPENHDNDEPAPDEDYMIASTGIVKALGVCLGTKDGSRVHTPRNMSPTNSGTATPRQGPPRSKTQNRPRDVSLELCESARKIRMRLRPALIKEDKAGNENDYRRLFFLDQTLQRMIQRFEDEYPETKVPSLPPSPPATNGLTSMGSSFADASVLSASADSNGLSKVLSGDEFLEAGEKEDEPHPAKLSRNGSSTSLAARAFTDEEGRMHRFGQTIRREVFKPTGTDDSLHGTSQFDPPEPGHIAALRQRVEQLKGDDIRQKVEQEGVDNVIRELGMNMEELRMLQKEDPAGFEVFRNAQLAAQINGGMISAETTS